MNPPSGRNITFFKCLRSGSHSTSFSTHWLLLSAFQLSSEDVPSNDWLTDSSGHDSFLRSEVAWDDSAQPHPHIHDWLTACMHTPPRVRVEPPHVTQAYGISVKTPPLSEEAWLTWKKRINRLFFNAFHSNILLGISFVYLALHQHHHHCIAESLISRTINTLASKVIEFSTETNPYRVL